MHATTTIREALKTEMFANVTIYSAGDRPAVGVPAGADLRRRSVRVWVVRDDKSIGLRRSKSA